jgi:hypothetical protein
MKRIIGVCIAALALAGVASAQAAPPAQPVVKLSGRLEVINGHIGLKADGVSYYIPRLRQLVGFVKEVQEGASVKVEGYAWPVPNQSGVSMLAITKLTIGGKDYDFSQDQGPLGGKGMRGGKRGGGGPGMGGPGMGGGMGRGQRW